MRKLETAGLAVTWLLVAVGVISLVAGLGGRGTPAARAVQLDERVPQVRVEVLNGAGIPGLAREVTRRLRDAGFDVVYFGNAGGSPREVSEVLDRSGQLKAARAVAGNLDIERVRAAPDTGLYVDVSVVLGKDWEKDAPTRR